jgi:hypothetical protein
MHNVHGSHPYKIHHNITFSTESVENTCPAIEIPHKQNNKTPTLRHDILENKIVMADALARKSLEIASLVSDKRGTRSDHNLWELLRIAARV